MVDEVKPAIVPEPPTPPKPMNPVEHPVPPPPPVHPAMAELQAKHDALLAENTALKAKLPPQPKAYEYKADECRPVYPGGKCEHCGWVRDGTNAEPHPIA